MTNMLVEEKPDGALAADTQPNDNNQENAAAQQEEGGLGGEDDDGHDKEDIGQDEQREYYERQQMNQEEDADGLHHPLAGEIDQEEGEEEDGQDIGAQVHAPGKCQTQGCRAGVVYSPNLTPL